MLSSGITHSLCFVLFFKKQFDLESQDIAQTRRAGSSKGMGYIHAHIHTSTQAHKRTHTHVQANKHTHTCAQAHRHTSAQAHAHRTKSTRGQLIWAKTHAYTQRAHKRTHSTQAHKRTHTSTCTPANAHKRTFDFICIAVLYFFIFLIIWCCLYLLQCLFHPPFPLLSPQRRFGRRHRRKFSSLMAPRERGRN